MCHFQSRARCRAHIEVARQEHGRRCNLASVMREAYQTISAGFWAPRGKTNNALLCSFSPGSSKAPCAEAIRTAQSIMKDIGASSSCLSDTGIPELAACHVDHSEHDMHRVVQSFGLELPIPLTPVPNTDAVALRLTDWADFLLKRGLWHMLAGLRKRDDTRSRAIWRCFWARYKRQCPKHPIFQLEQEGEVKLENTCAVLYHGDEGRGRKKKPFYVSSFSSVLGHGTSASKKKRRPCYLKQKLNYRLPSLVTRFLSSALPKSQYGKNETTFRALLSFAAEDAYEMMVTGRTCPRQVKHHMVVINVTGDWPWLMKCGRMVRGFTRGPKNTSFDPNTAAGICHMCLAGTKDLPFEELGVEDPQWLPTCHTETFYNIKPEFFNWPIQDESREAEFFAVDLWHSWHLGLAKVFLGSVLALMLPFCPGSKAEARYESMTEQYLLFCKGTKRHAYLTKITEDTITWQKKTDFPLGHWPKGSVSTHLLEWFISWFEEFQPPDPMLRKSYEAASAMSRCLNMLYSMDVWLPAKEATEIARLGLRFLHLYRSLAEDAFRERRALYALTPKAHMIHHWFLTGMLIPAKTAPHILNPLIFGCQIQEDFIGRPSRMARRVSPRQTNVRVAQRYLRAAYAAWVSEGYLS